MASRYRCLNHDHLRLVSNLADPCHVAAHANLPFRGVLTAKPANFPSRPLCVSAAARRNHVLFDGALVGDPAEVSRMPRQENGFGFALTCTSML